MNSLELFDVVTNVINVIIIGLLSSVGKLTTGTVSNCTLQVTWTPPYTLAGVPIRRYTFTITALSTGQVEESGTTNTTEIYFSWLSINETLNISVAAVNDVGTGKSLSIATDSQPGEPCYMCVCVVYSYTFKLL